MHHFLRHKRRHIRKTTELTLARLILAIGLAGIDTIWALYMDSFGLNESTIGFISGFLVIVTLFTAFYSTPILEKLREYKVLLVSLTIFIIGYLSIALADNLYVFLVFSIIITMAGVFRMESFDILFRDESNDKDLNRDEAFMYTIVNVGWLVGPLLAGFIMALYGITTVFMSSAIFVAITLLILLTLKIKQPRKKREKLDSNVKENIIGYIKNKNLNLAYIMAAGIEVWWALIYIYVPLFIINSGNLTEKTVGLFLAAVVAPLVILEYPAGKWSDKHGFKKLFFIGFLFLGISALISFFMTENITLVLSILVLASIAMALIEPIQDSYFFRLVSSNEEEKYYPIYATAGDVGSLISKFSIAFILLFLPLKFAYLIMAIFMFLLAIIALKIKN